MKYTRPSLLPFPFSALDDQSGNPTQWRVAGDRAMMLRQLTQVMRITLNINWNVTFYDGNGVLQGTSLNRTLVSDALPERATKYQGFYYKEDGSVFPDPASRVLATVPGGELPCGVHYSDPGSATEAGVYFNMAFNRTPSGVLQPRVNLQIHDGPFFGWFGELNLISSNDLIIDGANFGPLNLYCWDFYTPPFSGATGTFNVATNVEYWPT